MKNNGPFRLVICVDAYAKNLDEAYMKIYNAMSKVVTKNNDLLWESTDEWYDQDGNEGQAADIQNARMKLFTG